MQIASRRFAEAAIQEYQRDRALPVSIAEFADISDTAGLQHEVAQLEGRLAAATDQLTAERRHAKSIHTARRLAIEDSPVLRLVFGLQDTEQTTAGEAEAGDFTRPDANEPHISLDDILSSAFLRQVASPTLDEGFQTLTAKQLRAQFHTDRDNNDHETAATIGGALSQAKQDPGLSVATALLAARTETPLTAQELRIRRYQLTLSLAGVEPIFDSQEAAVAHAEKEIAGTEWRVRTHAAMKSMELLLGSNEQWTKFLQGIVKSQKMYLIDLVNRVQPEILSLQERMAKGEPIKLTEAAKTEIDAVFERIWSTLGNKEDSAVPYKPPYQNWLEILLPAMRLLDPGEKPDETYTKFEPPIRIVQVPRYNPPYRGQSYEDLFSPHKKSDTSYLRDLYDQKAGHESYHQEY
ncbi:MAG: hypothetical protein WBP26_05875 [Candidatus Saccharimonadales bacterium]